MGKKFASLTFVIALGAAGCQSPSANAPPSATTPTTTPPPPLSFELARAGLPEAGNWKCDPVLADFNADGQLDIAGTVRLRGGRRGSDGPRVWLGDGRGSWRETGDGLGMERSCGGGLAAGDVNGDGRPDLALADHCEGVFVFLNLGEERWELGAEALFPDQFVPADVQPQEWVGAEDVDLGDVNGDGFLDLVSGSSDRGGGITVWFGNGTGREWKLDTENKLPRDGWVPRVVLADINGDGKLDLAASHLVGPRVWLGDGRGGWREQSEGLPRPGMQGIHNGLAVSDLNRDGRADLAVANWVDGPEVYWQQGDGSWQKAGTVFEELGGGAFGVAAGDLNQDGRPDLVVSGRLGLEVGYVYGVYALLGQGDGTWKPVAGGGLPERGLAFTWGVALGDVDRDGTLDVVAASGGIVATSRKNKDPVLPAGILAWRTRDTSRASGGRLANLQ